MRINERRRQSHVAGERPNQGQRIRKILGECSPRIRTGDVKNAKMNGSGKLKKGLPHIRDHEGS